jgi:hypothetical protein
MTTPSQSKRWTILRRCLLCVAIFLTVIAAFYTEESWRGKRAWENCKRALEAKGLKMDWVEEIPAPVPDEQNILAVPEMQKWFFGNGATGLLEVMEDVYDVGDSNRPSTRIVVADVVIGPQGAIPPSGFTALSYGDSQAKAEVSRLINDAVGPYFIDPWSIIRMLRRPEEIQPAKILLQCQTAPTAKELEQFLPNEQIEPAGNGSYQVTRQASRTVAELLARFAVLEPQFTVMRQALQRPYVRTLGDYQDPKAHPTLAGFGAVARTLAALAQCHLLQGQPEEALRDLTLSQDLCRVLEGLQRNRRDLVVILVHETVTAIDIGVIADGLRRHAWREPQLAAFQEQFQKINFVSDFKQVMLAGPARVSDFYPNATALDLGEIYLRVLLPIESNKPDAWTSLKAIFVGHLIPRGWVYQNMVQLANGYQTIGESSDSSGQRVFPKKVDAVAIMAKSHPSPYNYLARISDPTHSKRCRDTAKIQTEVNEALIACALERYRLARNAFPETLDALVPQFLAQVPPDLIGGQPLHYRRADNGKFLLYSVGWNEKDDGGKPGSDDDWVWDDAAR